MSFTKRARVQVRSSLAPWVYSARPYLINSVTVSIVGKGYLRSSEQDSPVSLITDYRNLKSQSFPTQQHSGGLYLMHSTDFSINQ